MSNMSFRPGAVSMLVVIFTALLIAIVTVSFTQLMFRDQRSSSDNDLSRSAYDAALAGVEDAKRVLSNFTPSEDSDDILSECNGLVTSLAKDPSKEVQVGDPDLNQAYTCVKIKLDTKDYIGEIKGDQTRLVPLKSKKAFNQVRINWYSSEDTSAIENLEIEGGAIVPSLSSSWPASRPPVLEAQLIQTGKNFKLSDFNSSGGANEANTGTLFLYPKLMLTEPTLTFSSDAPRVGSRNGLTQVGCINSLTSIEYACSALINLPKPITGDSATRSNVFLRLTPRYKGTHFSIEMKNSGSDVYFDGVQPQVDSTGRASDLFRRVSARVELVSRTIYPDAAVDINDNFCKTFRLTDTSGGYDSGICTP